MVQMSFAGFSVLRKNNCGLSLNVPYSFVVGNTIRAGSTPWMTAWYGIRIYPSALESLNRSRSVNDLTTTHNALFQPQPARR